MPTYGWIREDDWEAFLEAKDPIDPPSQQDVQVFRCPFCHFIGATARDQQDHVTDHHRVSNPILFLCGAEPAKSTTIRSVLTRTAVVPAYATEAQVRINGGRATLVEVGKLGEVLCELRDAEVSIRLVNSTQAGAMPVSAEYRLEFRVADQASLKAVELAFAQSLVRSAPSRHAIDRFLKDPRCSGIGGHYADGLAAYVLGILLKEHPESERLTTDYQRYRDHYGAARLALEGNNRPLARLVSSIIRFSFNEFDRPIPTTGYWNLDLAASLLSDPEVKLLPPPPDPASTMRSVCPIDQATGLIVDLASKLTQEKRWSRFLTDRCRSLANSTVLDPVDRQKASALWAIMCWRLGAADKAVEPLRQVAAIYPFEKWASAYLEMMSYQ